jgi:hypothetical protein
LPIDTAAPRRGAARVASRRSCAELFWILALAAAPASVAGGQGLPSYAPINPVATSRSGLYFQPYHEARPGGWSTTLLLDYGSAIEYNIPALRPSYLLDAELLRIDLNVARDLGPRAFVQAEASLNGAYGGFLDGFLKWYHNLFGLRMPEREIRPNNVFAYDIALPDGRDISRSPSDLFLGDLRLGAGYRYNRFVQTVVSLTLPTTTGPAGYGRGTISLSALNTVRAQFGRRFTYEGSAGLGFTPTHGELADYQRQLFLSATSGLRFRFWGRQSLFANLFYHSPYYHDVTLHALDRHELSLDFGWLLRTKSGREWKIGMTEDPQPSGPAIDLVFRFGATF